MRRFRSFLSLSLLAVGPLVAETALAADSTTAESSTSTAPGTTANPKAAELIPTQETAPVPYPACQAGPNSDAIVAARGAFDAGNAAFNEANYPRALLYWEDAYQRDCTAHAMLKNLARAYELDGQLMHAIAAVETYLERVTGTGEEEALRNRIAGLKARLAERDAPAATAPSKQPPKKNGNARPSKPAQAATETELPVSQDSEPSPATGGRSAWPLVLAGVGAGVVGLSTVQWLSAKSNEQAAARACPDRVACPPAVEREGNQAIDNEIAWSIVGGAGGVALIAGVVWYLVQDPKSEQTVAPSISRDYAGVTWSGRF